MVFLVMCAGDPGEKAPQAPEQEATALDEVNMRTHKIATITALAIPLIFGGYSSSLHAKPIAGTPAAPSGDDYYRGSDVREWGRADGKQAAIDDLRAHLKKDVDDHEHYRHPPVAENLRKRYRDGFRAGYQDGIRQGLDGVHGYNNNDRDRHDSDDRNHHDQNDDHNHS